MKMGAYVVLLQACDELGGASCGRLCDAQEAGAAATWTQDEREQCLRRCQNVSRAYVSPLCWHSAGAANAGTHQDAFNGCLEGCRQLGCNRREFEYCAMGYLNKHEIQGSSGRCPDEWCSDIRRFYHGGGEFMARLADLYEAHRNLKSIALPMAGTRILDGVRSPERLGNLTLPTNATIM